MNLVDEYLCYPKERARAFLEKKGVPAHLIEKASHTNFSLEGGFHGINIWLPDETEHAAILYPVEYQGELINIVAWEPHKPHRIALRIPDDTFLGLEKLYEARTFRKVLRIFETPLDWLLADQAGVCPLTDDSLLELMGMTVDCSDKMYQRIKEEIEHSYPLPNRGKAGDSMKLHTVPKR